MKYKADAYEVAEFDLSRVVYVDYGNGRHHTCVFSQLLDENGELTEFTYDEVAGVYRPCDKMQVPEFSVRPKSLNTRRGMK